MSKKRNNARRITCPCGNTYYASSGAITQCFRCNQLISNKTVGPLGHLARRAMGLPTAEFDDRQRKGPKPKNTGRSRYVDINRVPQASTGEKLWHLFFG